MVKKIRDAVSIIFECQGEVFSITRQNFLRTFPGYTAFVGGKVDQDDHIKKSYNLHQLDDHPHHLINALVRETKEEVGVEIDSLIEKGIILSVDFIGRALTPEFNPYRFNTHFFRVSFKEKIDFRIDRNEVAEGIWSKPTSVLDKWKRGDCMMVPPVRYFFEKLELDVHFKDTLILENRFDLNTIVPWIESICGITQIMPLSNTVPPAERTNAFVIGDILIDPSPKNESEYNKLLNTIEIHQVKKIFITHHHKDHHQHSTKLAKELSVPMLMSKYTLNRCQLVYGEKYFEGIDYKSFVSSQ